MNYPKDRSVLVVRKKFFRRRICENVDCLEEFDPINPSAKCCSETCRNRKGYLCRKAIANGIDKSDKTSLWNYNVLHCLLDQRVLTPNLDFLNKYKFKFPDDKNPLQMMQLGDLVLAPMKDGFFKIIKNGKK